MNNTSLNKVFKMAGWNEELVEEFFKNPQPGVNSSNNDVEANDFFKTWFDNRISNVVDKVSREDLLMLCYRLVQNEGNSMDEPYVGTVISVTKKLINRQFPYSDNDHEWFATQDELTRRAWRRLHVLVSYEMNK